METACSAASKRLGIAADDGDLLRRVEIEDAGDQAAVADHVAGEVGGEGRGDGFGAR